MYASNNTDKKARAMPVSHELYTACNKSIGSSINNDELLETSEKDASYDLQHIIDDVTLSRMPQNEGQTDNHSTQEMFFQRPVITNPPSMYNEIDYITV